MVMIPTVVVVVTSVVVSFENLVVVGGDVVVETPGIVSLNPFVFSLERSGAAKEEERGRRNRASIIVAVVFTFGLFLNFCSLALLGTGGLLLLCQTRVGFIQLCREELPEEGRIKIRAEVFQRNREFKEDSCQSELRHVIYVLVTI